MNASGLTAYLLASPLLAALPGPGVAYIVTRTLTQGRSAGLASVLGVASGNLGNALCASFGLAALLAASSSAFAMLKFGGAAYLIWLGIQAWRRPAPAAVDAATASTVEASGRRRIFRDGFVVALLNPKTALFFAVFLPQFIEPAAPGSAALCVALGIGFVAIAACTDTAYLLAAGALAPVLRGLGRHRAAMRGTTAAVYIALGLWAALSGRPTRA